VNFIAALNSLNQPWVAILVIIIGMTFDIICQHFGVSNDAATGVIGAGVGLLTGQAINRATTIQSPTESATQSTITTSTQPVPSNSAPKEP
jgi:hypothetical protein